jgi:translocation and assembly module TamA
MALAILAAVVWLEPESAGAFDVFGLFGEDEAPPAPRADALPYRLTVTPVGEAQDEDSDLVQALQDVAVTWTLRQDAPPDAESLIHRVEGDLGPMLDTLWAYGYYNAELVATVAGVRVTTGAATEAGAVRATEALRGQAAVPVVVTARLGPLFHVRRVTVSGPDGGAPVGITEKQIGLKPGSPARAADIRAAAARLVDLYRARSHPLARATRIEATVDHAADTVDASLVIDAGPRAGLGEVTIAGTAEVPPAVVRSFVYREIGDPYSPKLLETTRKSVAQIPALGGVRIQEAAQPDSAGHLPLTVDVTERPRHLVGFDALYSSIDGPSLETYWEDHNLFGGAEQLRLEARAFPAPSLNQTGGGSFSLSDLSNPGGRVSASLMKPALWGSHDDLLVDAVADHERIGESNFDGYISSSASLSTAIRHRWSEQLSGQAGIKVEQEGSEDVLGSLDETLVSVPLSATWDTSDDLLDPTRGVRLRGSLSPFLSVLGSDVTMVSSQVSAAGYTALDEDATTVLAGRLGVGTLVGAGLASIPPDERFYAGGGGSVRGYGYRTLSPTEDGRVTGGRSLFEASAEARFRLTRTVGFVPFIDVGDAAAGSVPRVTGSGLGAGAGVGLRYLTAVGPIRLDLATPLIQRHGTSPVAVYISIGQAF